MSPQRKSRTYRSPGRAEQAAGTRLTIIAAARRLFAERGVAAATMEAIASEAGVAVQTVYFAFGSKQGILDGVVEHAKAEAEVGPLYERMLVEPDPRRQLLTAARITRQFSDSVADLIDVLRADRAAGGATAWVDIERRRRRGTETLARAMWRSGHLKPRVSATRAADVLFTLDSSEVYLLLTRTCGWKPAEYERWFVDAAALLLLWDSAPRDVVPQNVVSRSQSMSD